MMMGPSLILLLVVLSTVDGFVSVAPKISSVDVPSQHYSFLTDGAQSTTVAMRKRDNDQDDKYDESSNSPNQSSSLEDRRSVLEKSLSVALAAITVPFINSSASSTTDGSHYWTTKPSLVPPAAHAIGPVKINLKPTSYSAKPCPPSKPIPGQQAMKGMRGLCVTVDADLEEKSPKDLSLVGVYGFVTDAISGDSVLANNPDLSTDAGQFAMIDKISPTDTKVQFEFIAAIPMETDITQFDNGIGPLDFSSLRIISFPGGQQYGAINPCEMNEFSDECASWEEENGPYVPGQFMMKSKK